MFTVERYHDISAGHRVTGHESKCRFLHGHNYRIHFVIGHELFWAGDKIRGHDRLDDVGRVLDFSVIKSKLCQWLEDNWDHKFLIWEHDHLLEHLKHISGGGILAVSFNPTAENMARYLVEVVGPKVLDGTGCQLIEVRVEETRKCSATYKLPA